ncbi:MAG TPA: tail fiber domain-containing protein, partial [Vicinamibacterales bacterium]|nr:tail fiber domain-containing protein [Vicinamibacterales bacterium]
EIAMRICLTAVLVSALGALTAHPVDAQPLGTFRWQLRPYCNVLSISITQVGEQYRLEGADDQCGGGRPKAALVGLAFLNPDGTIGFGMTVVTSPGGAPVHIDAAISVATFNGTWRDSGGGTGTLTFTPGAAVQGYPRAVPTSPVPSAVQLSQAGSVVANGTFGQGVAPASGSGTRMMWYPGKAAIRAGRVTGNEWDDGSVGLYSTAFGVNTRASNTGSTALGYLTSATGEFSTASGHFTSASGESSTALGDSTIAAGLSGLAFGSHNAVTGNWAAGGGVNSAAAGSVALAFGNSVSASGDLSVTLGNRAVTTPAAKGSFVFGDSSSTNAFTSFAPNEFVVRAAGGVGFYTNAATTSGVELAPGGSSWAALSDVNVKENFRDVDGEDLLAKLADVPIREWNYKAQDRALRHMGPTAQDFRAAFGLGDFALRINTIDADGVALAGVQALEARTRALRMENDALRCELDQLRARLDALTK